MTNEIKRILDDYELSANIVAECFLNKQLREDGEPRIEFRGNDEQSDSYWLDEAGSVLVVGEIYYRFNDILTDLREESPVGEIDKWQEYDIECHNLGLHSINYYSWLHDAPRHSEEVMKFFHKLQDDVRSAKETFEEAIRDYNDGKGLDGKQP